MAAAAGALLALAASGTGGARETTVRVGLFNVHELTQAKLHAVDERGAGTDQQVSAAAAIIQELRPEILVLNEIDTPPGADRERPARALVANYLARGATPIDYPHLFVGDTNTGTLSGLDLDRDGRVATSEQAGTRGHGGDSYGFGTYPGQFGMAVLSQHPVDRERVRTFQHFRWRDLPGNHLPTDYYDGRAREVLRLSSKSHWDVPIVVAGAAQPLHLLVSHPTPPVFDGPENRNGRRNFDEIRFWALYLDGERRLVDDDGRAGGLEGGAAFVIAGDLNAYPGNAETHLEGRDAIAQLLDHERVQDAGPVLVSAGGLGGGRAGPPRFLERSTNPLHGGARLDYLLPARQLRVLRGGVYWPSAGTDPDGAARAQLASDHRFVWLEIAVPAQ